VHTFAGPTQPFDFMKQPPFGQTQVSTTCRLVGEQVQAPVCGELYDVQEVERSLAAPVVRRTADPVAPAVEVATPAARTPRPMVDEDDIPLTWDPVPVPRPTYTMKSRATRPAPTSADLVGDADTEYARYEQEPVRRVAGA